MPSLWKSHEIVHVCLYRVHAKRITHISFRASCLCIYSTTVSTSDTLLKSGSRCVRQELCDFNHSPTSTRVDCGGISLTSAISYSSAPTLRSHAENPLWFDSCVKQANAARFKMVNGSGLKSRCWDMMLKRTSTVLSLRATSTSSTCSDSVCASIKKTSRCSQHDSRSHRMRANAARWLFAWNIICASKLLCDIHLL